MRHLGTTALSMERSFDHRDVILIRRRNHVKKSVLTETKKPNEDFLVVALSNGDKSGFQILFNRFGPEVFALCHRILGNTQDAEDVTSEAFFEMWSNRHRFDSKRSSIRSYLMLIARSRAIDHLRSKRNIRRKTDPNVWVSESVTSALPGPQASAENLELQQVTRSILDTIHESQRVVLELSFYEGLSHSQIASKLDIPLGTVKSHIRKGLAKLRFGLLRFGTGELD